jgi:hypothetical protein
MATHTLGIVSDIHYAGASEQARGDAYEYVGVANPVLRLLLRAYRGLIWMRHPLRQGHLLEQFLVHPEPLDVVVANGDYSCDSAFIGVSDGAALESARECLGRLRARFGDRVHALMGDHELGKFSFVGGRGGLRLESYHRAVEELGVRPFWRMEMGRYTLVGVASSLLALPLARAEILPQEAGEWDRLRGEHLLEIDRAVGSIGPGQRVLLFCHDPSALPFLWRETRVRNLLPQVEQTVVGHLHSPWILRLSGWLRGMPVLRGVGHTARRLSEALREARVWEPFRVRLCPSLAGIELLKDGGYYTVELDADGRRAARFALHRVRR